MTVFNTNDLITFDLELNIDLYSFDFEVDNWRDKLINKNVHDELLVRGSYMEIFNYIYTILQ